jgi:hypothetical protein
MNCVHFTTDYAHQFERQTDRIESIVVLFSIFQKFLPSQFFFFFAWRCSINQMIGLGRHFRRVQMWAQRSGNRNAAAMTNCCRQPIRLFVCWLEKNFARESIFSFHGPLAEFRRSIRPLSDLTKWTRRTKSLFWHWKSMEFAKQFTNRLTDGV